MERGVEKRVLYLIEVKLCHMCVYLYKNGHSDNNFEELLQTIWKYCWSVPETFTFDGRKVENFEPIHQICYVSKSAVQPPEHG